MISGHYIRNFVRFHACFGAFWNLTAATGKANKTDPIRPLLPDIGLELWRGHVPPVWIRPSEAGLCCVNLWSCQTGILGYLLR